jgi:predicted transcriptional regulator of viral defense system
MTFLQFKAGLKDFVAFNLNDIRKIDVRFDLRRLNEWQGKSYIKMIRRGYYAFSDLEINDSALFLIANKIYAPSYISMEMALSYYNMIPEAVYGITSVSSRKTNRFQSAYGEFIYRHIKPSLLFGYKLIVYKNHKWKIAEIEKAVLDFLYLNPHLRTAEDFAGLRFNDEEFQKIADRVKLDNYLAAFANKSMERRFKNFMKSIAYA